jgi:hypothetical protein
MMTEKRQALTSLGVMLAALLVCELAFRTSDLRDRLEMEDIFTSRLHHYRSLGDDPDVVVVGNSRVRHGIDPGIIRDIVEKRTGEAPVVFNLGMGGVVAQPQLALSLRMLDRPRRPRVVVLLVSPTNFLASEKPELAHNIRTKLWRPADIPSVIRAGGSAQDVLTIAVSASLTTMSHRSRILDVLLDHECPGPAMGPDEDGFTPVEPVAPAVQRSRARSRAQGYRGELVSDSAELSDFKLGCLDEAVRRLGAEGVGVVIVNSPASTPIQHLAIEKGSVVPEYLRRVQQIAESRGVVFLDHLAPPVLSDRDFADGDHLDVGGARRYTAFLVEQAILPVGWGIESDATMRYGPPEPSEGCEVVFDFEDVSADGWDVKGKAFDRLLASGAGPGQSPVVGFKGVGMLSSWHAKLGDGARGEAVSPSFGISRPVIKLLVGGGSENVIVQLVVSGRVVRSASGHDRETLEPVVWDVGEFIGQQAAIVVRDESTGSWGHISLDQVELCQ